MKGLISRLSLLMLGVGLLVGLAASTARAQQQPHYFPETGYGVENAAIWRYVADRGGMDTFGYPVSNSFLFRGLTVQIFQRHVLQVVGNTVRPVNLLDPDWLPITRVGGLTLPAHDPSVAVQAPPPSTPNYGAAVEQYLQQAVPDQWEGAPLYFHNYYLSSAPGGGGAMRALTALEVWGFPTSRPARDPNNHNFIYQRFQRGFMHYDATRNVTRGILLGDAFKAVLRDRNLSPDLRAEMLGSPYLGLYAPGQPSSIAREAPQLQPPITRANTNMTGAFAAEDSVPTFTTATVYLIALDTGGPVGCGDSLVAVTRPLPAPTTMPLTASIRELLSIKDRVLGQSGLYNALYQSNLAVERLTLENRHATIWLTGQYRVGGVCDEPRVLQQLRATATQFQTVDTTDIYVNGTLLR